MHWHLRKGDTNQRQEKRGRPLNVKNIQRLGCADVDGEAAVIAQALSPLVVSLDLGRSNSSWSADRSALE